MFTKKTSEIAFKKLLRQNKIPIATLCVEEAMIKLFIEMSKEIDELKREVRKIKSKK